MVTFEFTVTNTSAVDTVELDTLTDSMFGDLDGQGTCTVPQTLAPGGAYICVFDTELKGLFTRVHRNVVRAEGTTDDGAAVGASDNAIVRFLYAVRSIPATGRLGLAVCCCC